MIWCLEQMIGMGMDFEWISLLLKMCFEEARVLILLFSVLFGRKITITEGHPCSWGHDNAEGILSFWEGGRLAFDHDLNYFLLQISPWTLQFPNLFGVSRILVSRNCDGRRNKEGKFFSIESIGNSSQGAIFCFWKQLLD